MSVDGQKFKAHKVIIPVSRNFFKKLLVNTQNHHPLIFMKKKLKSHYITLIYHDKMKTWMKPGRALCDIYHYKKTVQLKERVIMEARWKVKKKLKARFACIGTVAFARKVNVTMFILMKTVIFICRVRHEGIANEETYRDIWGQTGTDKDSQGQKGTDMDKQGQAWTDRDRQGQVGISRYSKGMSLFVPTGTYLSPPCCWPTVLGDQLTAVQFCVASRD